MQFKVIRSCKDALSRQITEAVWIEEESNLNSRSEWGRNPLSRIRIINKDTGKSIDTVPPEKSSVEEEAVASLKERVKVCMEKVGP